MSYSINLKKKSIIDKKENVFFLLFVVLLYYFAPHIADASDSAGGNNVISTGICNVVRYLTGPIGQSVSTVAVVFIGVGIFLGKVSWGLALGTTVGMTMVFGAENVVTLIGGNQQAFRCADYIGDVFN